MSEYTFYLVPTDRTFVATAEQLNACGELWRAISPGVERTCIYNHPQMMLWNPMDIAFVKCPRCGTTFRVTFDFELFKSAEQGAWWQELVLMMQCDEGDGSSAMPCCGAVVSNEEVFEHCSPNPRFSLFACGAHEPNMPLFESEHGPLRSEHVVQFEQLLGLKFEHLWLGN